MFNKIKDIFQEIEEIPVTLYVEDFSDKGVTVEIATESFDNEKDLEIPVISQSILIPTELVKDYSNFEEASERFDVTYTLNINDCKEHGYFSYMYLYDSLNPSREYNYSSDVKWVEDESTKDFLDFIEDFSVQKYICKKILED